jgi:hypothetical protein
MAVLSLKYWTPYQNPCLYLQCVEPQGLCIFLSLKGRDLLAHDRLAID